MVIDDTNSPEQGRMQQSKKNRRRGRAGTDSGKVDGGKNHVNDAVRQQRPHGKVTNHHKSSAFTSSRSSSVATSTSKNNTTTNDNKNDDVTAHTTLLIPVVEENELWYNGFGPVTPERNATILVTTNNNVEDNTTTNTSKSQQQTKPNPLHIVVKYRTMADQIYRNEIMLFNNNNNHHHHHTKGSNGGTTSTTAADTSFLEHTISRGTLKDKIAAMSVLVSTYPIHKLHILDSLLSMVGCSINNTNNNSHQNRTSSNTSTTTNSRVVQMAAEALEDLFIHTLLPKDRKLVTLQQRPLLLYENHSNYNTDDAKNSASVEDDATNGNKKKRNKKKQNNNVVANTKRTLSPRILLFWRYEEMIKERYDIFLRYYVARTLSNDIPTSISPSSNAKVASTSTTNLDGPKIAALRTGAALLRAVPEGETYLLPLLVNKLGDPKATICNVTAHELRKILHLHPSMVHIMAREVQQLVHRPHLSINAIYNCITFLNQLKLVRSTETKDDDPYALLAVSLMNTYFRLFDIAIQKPSTQQQKASHKGSSKKDTNDIHQSRLLSALLTGVNRAHPYLPPPTSTNNKGNPKNTTNVSSILDEHIDALYRVVHTAPPAARTQSLLLLFHIAVGTHSKDSNTNSDKNIAADTTRHDRFYRALYATLSDPNMVGAGKHVTMYFNLLYKAMKADNSENNTVRLISFTKRLWSTALHCSSSVLAAVLFLIDTIANDHHPFLHSCYRSILSERDALRVLDPTKREPRGALVVLNDDISKNNTMTDDEAVSADLEISAPGWELALTTYHYHPSVKKFAEMFGSDMKGIGSSYTGDPLRDFALAPFLDKFAYRNPKAVQRTKSESVLDDNDEATATVMEKFSHSVGARRQRQTDQINQPLNDPSFIESSNVNDDEVFFHKFFVERAKRDSMKGIVRNKSQTSDGINDDDDAEIAALDRAESRHADQSKIIDEMDDYDTWDQWETDDEEEAFVDSLAQQIIEDSMEGNLIDDLDDEDPDMDDWDDLHDDGAHNKASIDENEDDDGDDNHDDGNDDDEESVDENNLEYGDADAFMDQDDSDSSEGDIGIEGEDEMFDHAVLDEEDDEDEDAAILLAEEVDDGNDLVDSDDNDDEEEEEENDDDDDDDDDNNLDYFSGMIDDEDEDEDDEAPLLQKVPVSGRDRSDGVFAAAEDYAELVEQSWKTQKRIYTSWDDDHPDENDDNVDDDEAALVRQQPATTNGSKKKRRKRTHEK